MANVSRRDLVPSVQADTLERIRVTAKISRHDWLDILEMPYGDYQKFKSGQMVLSERSLQNVAGEFAIPIQKIQADDIDFSDLTMRLEAPNATLPERYSRAAYSRKRSLLSAFDYLEKTYGWRLRLDIQQKFGVPERDLRDAFEPISIRFITDVCAYLKRRSFCATDFHAMGAYTFEGNKNTVLAQIFGETRNSEETFELLFGDARNLYEQNCDYRILGLESHRVLVEMNSNPHVAAETGVRHLGNEATCLFKGGIFSTTPMFIGLPAATVTHTTCVHRGDTRCRYEIEYDVTAVESQMDQRSRRLS